MNKDEDGLYRVAPYLYRRLILKGIFWGSVYTAAFGGIMWLAGAPPVAYMAILPCTLLVFVFLAIVMGKLI